MIINSETVELIRRNATRLAHCITQKNDLAELAMADGYEAIIGAIESILTHTDMFFDDELLAAIDSNTWRNFKSILMVYTLNLVNKNNTVGTDVGFTRDFQAYANTNGPM